MRNIERPLAFPDLTLTRGLIWIVLGVSAWAVILIPVCLFVLFGGNGL